jgi:predicted phage-related endonuclease
MSIIERKIGRREEWLGWRRDNVNASEGACLFGENAHPYLTAYKLWADRSGLLAPEPDNPTLRRGRLLEPVAIELLREERPGWEIYRPNVYLCDPEARIGATPDVYAARNELSGQRTRGNIQIKTAGHFAFRKNWIDPETRLVEIPLWIAVQSSIEAYLSGADWTAVAVMAIGDGGIEFYVEEFPIKASLIGRFKGLVDMFWHAVEKKEPPAINFDRDIETLFDVYSDDDGSMIDLTRDSETIGLLRARKIHSAQEKRGREAEVERKKIDAQIVARLGNASSARIGPVLVYAKTVKNKGYTVVPFQYRPVRVKGDVSLVNAGAGDAEGSSD